MDVAYWICGLLRGFVISRATLVAENLVLRQQLAVLSRSGKHPKLRPRDRILWVWISRLWTDWRSTLVIVQPTTVIKWHRQGFKLYWRWKSRKTGRPKIDSEIRALIRRISRDNALWGVPRVQSELGLLGHDVAESTVARYMVRRRPGPPSQTWRSFLKNHMDCAAACDFFTVPTVTFRMLFVFVVLAHNRRRIAQINVTAHPTAEWTAQQIIEAFPADGTEPRYLIRDRDSIYGGYFRQRVKNMGLKEVVIAWRSPWQNPHCERVGGTLRRECLDHVIVLNETHLRRILVSFLGYYHASRPHQSLGRNAPTPRHIEPPSRGKVIAFPQVGGLHQRYSRAA